MQPNHQDVPSTQMSRYRFAEHAQMCIPEPGSLRRNTECLNCQGPCLFYTSLLAFTDALQVAESKFANSGVDVTTWVQLLRREAITLTQHFCDLLGLVHCGINVTPVLPTDGDRPSNISRKT